MVLFTLMLSAPPEDGMPPTGRMSVAVDQLARRFAVSRRHVRNVLDRAVAAGLLARAGADGTAYVMAPRLRTDVVAFFAAMLLIVAEAIVQVEAAERSVHQAMNAA
jgi:DNA-binding FadR family transcriptional regulator